MWESQPESGRALVIIVAVALVLTTIGLGFSLVRIEAGALMCADGAWSYASDAGLRRCGTLEVAMDLGSFLLLRLVDERRRSAWLPVQRRGLEAQWHALRCAVYAPAPRAAGEPTAGALPSQ
jgi:hypothetical protein